MNNQQGLWIICLIFQAIMTTSALHAWRLAVVTGANKGVGYQIALQLGRSGLFDHVLLGCRDMNKAGEAVRSIQVQLPKTVKVSALPLKLEDKENHNEFVKVLETRFGKVDVLVNNAATAFKGSDPTPFEGQTKPTLDVNYRGTADLTERLLPLLKKGKDPRIVSVASVAGLLRQLSTDMQAKFTAPDLTMPQLNALVDDFERDVQDGSYKSKGWGSSNYGFSKLAVVAATKVWARENPEISINCCCPGYCKTDMSSHRGDREPSEGAKNAVIPATMVNPPTGAFFRDFKVATW